MIISKVTVAILQLQYLTHIRQEIIKTRNLGIQIFGNNLYVFLTIRTGHLQFEVDLAAVGLFDYSWLLGNINPFFIHISSSMIKINTHSPFIHQSLFIHLSTKKSKIAKKNPELRQKSRLRPTWSRDMALAHLSKKMRKFI